ncbi:DUF455 family protein [Paenibacillus sp. NPDC056579]|uniref:DUF455 family protein n=1 Tax=Paenibacillus sp. NPDC056579 TaxID=3345871 RepID=UPI00368AD9E8
MNEHKETNVLDQETIAGAKGRNLDRYLRPIDTAKRLKQLMWCEFELSRAAFGWLPAVPDYEAKTRLARYGYVHNQNMKHLYDRLNELPGTLNEKNGTPPLIREAFERMSMASNAAAFFTGYAFVLRQLFAEYESLRLRLDSILDAPTADKLKIIDIERNGMIEWASGQSLFADTEDNVSREHAAQWNEYVTVVWLLFRQALEQGTDVSDIRWPVHPTDQPAGPVPTRASLDPKFPVYQSNANYKKAYEDPDLSPLRNSIKQMHYINATEIGAAEQLCYFYYGVQHMPLQFYFDAARHLWDEVRHSQMGVRRLEQMGYSTEQFKFFQVSIDSAIDDLKAEYFPDMYSSLTMVAEPCSFIKKRKSAEMFWKFGDALSAIHCEFDMVDERMHVDFGKKWGPELYKQINDPITAQEMSERTRARRLEQLGAATTPEQIKQIIKNFPGFCGLSTIELEYSTY